MIGGATTSPACSKKLEMSRRSIWSHAHATASRSSLALRGRRPRTSVLILVHACSIGFISGEYLAWNNNITPALRNRYWTHGALCTSQLSHITHEPAGSSGIKTCSMYSIIFGNVIALGMSHLPTIPYNPIPPIKV